MTVWQLVQPQLYSEAGAQPQPLVAEVHSMDDDESLTQLLDRLDSLMQPGVAPTDRVRFAHEITHYADQLLHAEVRQARMEGTTWARLGETLGCTRQAVTKRFGRPTARVRTVN